MPEHDPEQELGPKISSAFQNKADASELTGSGMARKRAGASGKGARHSPWPRRRPWWQ